MVQGPAPCEGTSGYGGFICSEPGQIPSIDEMTPRPPAGKPESRNLFHRRGGFGVVHVGQGRGPIHPDAALQSRLRCKEARISDLEAEIKRLKHAAVKASTVTVQKVKYLATEEVLARARAQEELNSGPTAVSLVTGEPSTSRKGEDGKAEAEGLGAIGRMNAKRSEYTGMFAEGYTLRAVGVPTDDGPVVTFYSNNVALQWASPAMGSVTKTWRVDGRWGREERLGGCPFPASRRFELQFARTATGLLVTIDGVRHPDLDLTDKTRMVINRVKYTGHGELFVQRGALGVPGKSALTPRGRRQAPAAAPDEAEEVAQRGQRTNAVKENSDKVTASCRDVQRILTEWELRATGCYDEEDLQTRDELIRRTEVRRRDLGIDAQEEHQLKHRLGDMLLQHQKVVQNANNELSWAEQRLHAADGILENMRKLTQALPGNVVDFKVLPRKSDAEVQTHPVTQGFASTRLLKPGWKPSILECFLPITPLEPGETPPFRCEPGGKTHATRDAVIPRILEIYSARVAHAMSKDFKVAEEQLGAAPTARTRRRGAQKGMIAPPADPLASALADASGIKDAFPKRILQKTVAGRNMAHVGEPISCHGTIHFPDFVFDFAVRAGWREMLQPFLRSCYHWVKEKKGQTQATRLQVFLNLCQLGRIPGSLEGDTFVGEPVAYRLFSILAWITLEVASERFGTEVARRLMAKSEITQDDVMSIWTDLRGRFALSSVYQGLTRGLPGLSKARAGEVYRRLENFAEEDREDERRRRVVSIDLVMQQTCHVLRFMADEHRFAFERFYRRRLAAEQDRLVRTGSTQKLTELPLKMVHKYVGIFSGVDLEEAVFARIYTRGLVFTDQDPTGCFDVRLFADALLEYQLDLGRLVSAYRLLPRMLAALKRLRAYGHFGSLPTFAKPRGTTVGRGRASRKR